MRRGVIRVFLPLIVASLLLSGCGSGGGEDGDQGGGSDGGGLSIVCTTFPQYDWVRQILGDMAGDIELTLLLKSRIDLHSYQPSIEDIAKISSCDLFIYVGGESDEWVGDVLQGSVNPDMIAASLMEMIGYGAMPVYFVEGMQEDEDDDEDELDEHVWLSLRNAQTFCEFITDALGYFGVENIEAYRANLRDYTLQLETLDAQYKEVTDAANVRTLLFGDRFPFQYLMDDYGLAAYAAFSGCSAETEASFDTIAFLTSKADELGLASIMVTESSDQSIARAIINGTSSKDQQILALDSMQSVTESDILSGATYLTIMERNLDVLREALR